MFKKFFGEVPRQDWEATLAIAGYAGAAILFGLYGALVRWIAN